MIAPVNNDNTNNFHNSYSNDDVGILYVSVTALCFSLCGLGKSPAVPDAVSCTAIDHLVKCCG